MPVRATTLAAFIVAALLPTTAAADTPAATPEEVAFFLGRWATGPAPVEGFETFAAEAPSCERAVEISAAGDGLIARTAHGGASATFRVMRIAGRFPWWPVDGGPAPVARRAEGETFDLAPTQMGQADWSRAIRHERCPP